VNGARRPSGDGGRPRQHLVEELLRIDPECERMTVAAVGRGDAVAVLEQARDAGGDRFLAGVEMRRAVDLAGEEERLDEILEAADEQHLPVQTRVELVVVEGAGYWGVDDVTHATP